MAPKNREYRAICREFQQKGTCRYGPKCKFAHPSGSGNGLKVSTSNANTYDGHEGRGGGGGRGGRGRGGRDSTADRAKIRRLGGLLSNKGGYTIPSQALVGEMLKLSLEMIDGELGVAQAAIRELLTEDGFSFVKVVTDRSMPEAQTIGDQTRLWNTQLRPLFQIVTHQRVIDSAVLEQEVGQLFSFLLGVGGQRIMRILPWVATLTEGIPMPNMSAAAKVEAIELTLAVVAKILDCNTASTLNDGFQTYVDQFSNTLKTISSGDDASQTFSQLQAAKYLDYIQLRLAVGQDIPLAADAAASTPAVREAFILQRDLPGQLSHSQARHDNDHANIEDISIMPTMEEILSPRAEYLPTTDSTQWHRGGIQGRLDREFRLLREDTVGQLRDAIRDKFEALRSPDPGAAARRGNRNLLRTSTYTAPTVVALRFERNAGIELAVEFRQPEAIRNASIDKRREWWTHGKRLREGALVCVLNADGSVLYFEVTDSTLQTGRPEHARLRRQPSAEEEEGDEKRPLLTLADDKEVAYVSLRLVDATDNNVGQVLRWYRNIGWMPKRYLIEFPGVMLASFKFTLQALQEMHRKPDVPFSHLIAPERPGSDATMQPPLYTRSPGFSFQLGQTDFRLSPHIAAEGEREQVSAAMQLDETQADAFMATMRRGMSLVQGPPGTGKSYTGEKIIQTLIAHQKTAQLGAILCVCYTNHALDQLLEHLLDDGVKQLVRIGSQSKSERLQDCNLRVVARGAARTRPEGQCLFDLYNSLDDHAKAMDKLLRLLETSTSPESVKAHLRRNVPRHYAELFGQDTVDADGFVEVQRQPKTPLSRWLHQSCGDSQPTRPVQELTHSRLADLTLTERRNLHQHWQRAIRDPLITQIIRECRRHHATQEHIDRVRREVDLRCLQEAHVVGVTTTGLARNLHMLRKLHGKVLVCEEAGEVLEAHLLTALLPSVEHAILIGDHQQLRPQIQNYELQSANPRGRCYSLDMSLFERLVQPPHAHDVRLPFSSLATQRRMHPAISDLVRMTLYPRLTDGPSVAAYPEVCGMRRRLFWLHHTALEAAATAQDANSTSHWNAFEVDMTVALVSHLVRQGTYGPGDIAVLTPYLGQLHKLRRRMEAMFEVCLNDRDQEELEAFEATAGDVPDEAAGPPVAKTTLLKSVRVATVDNFQGEEAKVVCVSLVRSNPQNRCGFLSTSNRINVLLSRAQHGMYLLGNADTYGHVLMWADVLGLLRARGCFGTALELQCPRHPDTPIHVSQPDHFAQLVPEGGCGRRCADRLPCGHRCHGRCHAALLHAAAKCIEPCPRLKDGCTHACPRLCGDPCHDKCQTVLPDVHLALPCGHVLPSPLCWQAQSPADVTCHALVSRTVPGCGHTARILCNVDCAADAFRCKAACGHPLPCGHTCRSPCHRCRIRKEGKITSEDHGVCQQLCGRGYRNCRHACTSKCHADAACAPCSVPCETRCSHSRCRRKCSEPCPPCAEETCSSQCQHSACTMPCAAPCDWLPCSRRCDKTLDCGHQCPSLCGEVCPGSKYCHICGSDEIKDTVVDLLEMAQYRDIDLDEKPCIFPTCGHFLTIETMDGVMEMSKWYNVDEMGRMVSLRAPAEPFSMDKEHKVEACASCRGSLRSLNRYGRIVRRALLDEATKKFISWSNTQYAALAGELVKEQAGLAAASQTRDPVPHGPARGKTTAALSKLSSRAAQLQTITGEVGGGRYAKLLNLRRRISAFAAQVRKEEQPFQRVAELVAFANRKRALHGSFSFDESVIQLKGQLLAGMLLLRCELVVVSDFFQNKSEAKAKLTFVQHLDDCRALVQLAQATNHPLQEVEGHVYLAQLCHFARAGTAAAGQPTQAAADHSDQLITNGLNHVEHARLLMQTHPSTKALENEATAAERMLKDGVFYMPVSSTEMKAVYAAMAAEFSGTGHWYTCVQGHPFTIGECGMPMEMARCPECNSPVGGQNHATVEGVRRADAIEEMARDMARVRV